MSNNIFSGSFCHGEVFRPKGEVTRTMPEGPFEVIKQEANKVSLYL
jgi:hypothetical protein